jgi:sulfonate transport system permease protein
LPLGKASIRRGRAQEIDSVSVAIESGRQARAKPRIRSLSLGRWASPLALLALWEAGSRAGVIPSRILAAPSSVVLTLWSMILSGDLPTNLLVSLARAGAGLLIGVVVGSLLAVGAGLSKRGELAIDPPLQMLRTLPALALSPLLIVWLGIGESAKIALIAFATTFPIYLNLYNGVRGVDVRLVEAARSFGLSDLEVIRHVIIPAALPSFLVGLRYALSVSVLILVAAEQINAQAGLGYLINNARDFMRTDILVVCLLVYALLGLGADFIVRTLERRVLAWRPSLVER